MNLVMKRTLTLLIVLLLSHAGNLQAQLSAFAMQPGEIVLKTNPLMYLRPEVNLSAEVGIRENLSLEGRVTWFPATDWPETESTLFFPSVNAEGITAQMQLRHYVRPAPILFFSWGMMFKKWEYRDYRFVRNSDDGDRCYDEDRRALVFGPRVLSGFRIPFFNERAVFETYGGLSLKFRFDEGIRRANGQCINTATLGTFQEKNTLVGLNTGFNIGILLNRD